jgi:glycosyltransferase involved in cell wall biosynthesis
MMRFAICTPDVAPGDAVSNDVIGMHQALNEYGCEVRIFAQNIYVPWPEVHDLEKIGSFLQDSGDVIIYHHSVGWDAGLGLLSQIKCCRVIKYHNVTPTHFFEGLADNYVVACRKGREQLSDLRKLGADLYLADSAYNLDELLVEGRTGSKYGVIPPFHCIDRLQNIEADSAIVDRFGNADAKNLLMVGRIVPNKGYSYLIEVFHAYRSQYNSNSRLLLAGKEDPVLEVYTKALHRQVSELGLDDSVFFLGAISDAALKACYQVADAFVIASLHEGFCVPLVEAMSMQVPIVGYSSGAIPETVGNAGFIWKDRDPELLAYSLDLLTRDERIRVALSQMGLRRYKSRFSNDNIRQMLLAVLKDGELIG